jgi:hypothetical protein
MTTSGGGVLSSSWLSSPLLTNLSSIVGSLWLSAFCNALGLRFCGGSVRWKAMISACEAMKRDGNGKAREERTLEEHKFLCSPHYTCCERMKLRIELSI